MKDAEGGSPERADSYEGRVTLEILDIKQMDLLEIDRSIREMGLAAEQIVFDGLPHFRLEASVKHVCCQMCATALDRGLDMAKALPSAGRLRWIDSVAVSKEKKTVTLFARFGHAVDITELLSAFNHLGFAPHALRVLPGDKS